MYETLVRPIEVFQIPPLQPISILSEKLKRSEVKREDKRLRQIAANKAASAKRKRGAVGIDGNDVDGGLNVTELTDGADEIGTNNNKRFKMEDDDSFATTGEDGVVEEAQNMNIDAIITDPSTSALSLAPAPAHISTPLSTPTSHAVADIQTTTAPTKINVSKALPEVRGHTSYLTFACLIPIATLSSEVPTDRTISD